MTVENISKFGIVGAGGAGFPTHVKLDSNPDVLIMNAAECEPLLHKDMEILRSFSDEVLDGFKVAMKITGASQGIIGIKKKQQDVINLLSSKISGNIEIKKVNDIYPAGDEITLIYLTTKRIVQPGNLPISEGCVVQNVETLYNIGIQKPVIDKFISIAGAVQNSSTIRVPIGISYEDILKKFKITTRNFVIRSGGLMMGEIEKDHSQVVTKRTGALIVLPSDHYCVTMYDRFATDHNIDRIAKAACDQCTFCTDLCPRYLLGHPVRPETAMRNRMFTREEDNYYSLGNSFCCECNLCTMYSCPESLDPKGATVIEKRFLYKNDLNWEGLPVKPHPFVEFRQVPTKKLMQRLDVLKFKDEGPLTDVDFNPAKVRIPLGQHIGTPAKAIVEKGDAVQKYDQIGRAQGNISTNVHASIDGRVTKVNEREIVIQR
jgi:Na+-translocating ferredoxin:NAD+ oxidoreductase RnfC subunit